MRFARFSVLLRCGATGRVAALSLLASLLLGCVPRPAHVNNQTPETFSEAEHRVVDFQVLSCEKIWAFNSETALTSPLYWLRSMDCAQHLSAAEARAESRRWPADNWQSRFKRAVLLSNGNVTPMERRQYLQQLDASSADYPEAVRPLLTLWREGQGSLLQLSAERTRYAALQQTSDAELALLHQQQESLTQELSVTRRKLDSLTDIERQLSSRRSPDAADSPRSSDKTPSDGAASSASPSEDDATP